MECSIQFLFQLYLTHDFSYTFNIIIITLFIVQCWTQASKPEPLKQDTQKEKKKINLYSTFKDKLYIYKHSLNENTKLNTI